MKRENPVGLNGMEFIEFSSPSPEELGKIFEKFGFQKVAKHKTKDIRLYRQNDINFVINCEKNSFAENFRKLHGPSACAMGWRVHDAQKAFEVAVARGAKPYEGDRSPYTPAVYGVGDSLIYFVDQKKGNIYDLEFDYITENKVPRGKGFLVIDHLTNNVPQGEMDVWYNFYQKVFNFEQIRYFNIRGQKTGLLSRALKAPDGKITIPINEPTDDKSQIQEYIKEYKGSGIQHIAFLTDDICKSLPMVLDEKVEFLDTPDTYFEMIPERLPNVTENLKTLHKLKIQVDGDEEGYLLQIFTKNLVGPIFIELIQRKNHEGFGEGNFQALFEAMERDQIKRGVL